MSLFDTFFANSYASSAGFPSFGRSHHHRRSYAHQAPSYSYGRCGYPSSYAPSAAFPIFSARPSTVFYTTTTTTPTTPPQPTARRVASTSCSPYTRMSGGACCSGASSGACVSTPPRTFPSAPFTAASLAAFLFGDSNKALDGCSDSAECCDGGAMKQCQRDEESMDQQEQEQEQEQEQTRRIRVSTQQEQVEEEEREEEGEDQHDDAALTTTTTATAPSTTPSSLMSRLFSLPSYLTTSSWGGDVLGACDVRETPSEYIVSLDAPGLTAADVKVHVSDDQLIISGKRDRTTADADGAGSAGAASRTRTHRSERTFGVFTRVFSLPDGVDADNVRAAVENGVVSVLLPKINAPVGEDTPAHVDTQSTTTPAEVSEKKVDDVSAPVNAEDKDEDGEVTPMDTTTTTTTTDAPVTPTTTTTATRASSVVVSDVATIEDYVEGQSDSEDEDGFVRSF